MSVASTSKSVILEIEEESPSSSQRLEIEEESLHPPIMEVQKEYPYPSHNFATNIVTVKLSGKAKYKLWNTQMLCLLSSHDMLGFIDGTFPCPSNGNGKAKYGDMKAWHRSESLVKGWILGSLSEEVAINVVNHLNSDFTAKAVWDELQCCYGPSVPDQQAAEISIPQDEAHDSTAQSKMEDKQALYKDCLRGRWYTTRFTPVDKITNNGNTALHVAVGSSSKNHKFLEELLESTPAENTLLDVQNSDGSTPLHVAAIVGNTEAAKILLRRNRNLLFATDKAGHTPLAISLSNMHIETSKCLLEHITEKENETVFTGKSGDELLVLAISSKNWEFASELLGRYGTIHSEAVLRAMSQNYPRRCNFWDGLEDYFEYQRQEELERATVELLLYGNRALELLLKMKPRRAARLRRRFVSGIFMIRGVPLFLFRKVAWSFMRKRYKNRVDAGCLLRGICAKIKYHSSANTYHHYYNNTIFEATKQNASDVVQSVVSQFTDAIWCINEDGHNFIQYAVINRSAKVYSLVYKMSEHRNIYKTIKDSFGNNLLHLAARLAPANRLNNISGAALQLQRELQWFKEIEEFVCPLNRTQKNYADETPEMVFTREHKDLVSEGEKWMKTTAESYTITAALITTVVFAAAITVPGGNNQDSGIPIFTNDVAFITFAVADAISLFTAVTSLLMFLSILTTRFAEQDFLFKLPKRLIIGLTMLFISTTTMIIAFGATLFLVFGQRKLWMLIPICLLTCLPITSFVTLQFPLIVDLISATYGRSIFVKKHYGRPFY